MGIEIVQGDITRQKVDAIVNAANSDLRGGAGVCGAIFKAAGWEGLQRECDLHYPVGVATGRAAVTTSQALVHVGIKMIVHAVGPVWNKNADAQTKGHLATQLDAAYRNACEAALRAGARSIAFPAISTGVYGFPKLRAARIAMTALADYEQDFDKIAVMIFPGDADTLLSYQAMVGTAVVPIEKDGRTQYTVLHQGATVGYAETAAEAREIAKDAPAILLQARGSVAATGASAEDAAAAETRQAVIEKVIGTSTEGIEDVEAEITDGDGSEADVTVEVAASTGRPKKNEGQAALDL